MDSEIKQKWLTALRSGAYPQGQNVLRSADNEFCCLGVLCDVLDPDAWGDPIPAARWRYNWSGPGTTPSVPAALTLPSGVRELVGLSYENIDSLVIMNDNHQKSFSEIADWIGENL